MILLLIQSCVSKEKKVIIVENPRYNSTHLFIKNDSILELNKTEFHISELEFHLDRMRSASTLNARLTIEPDSEVKMHTIKRIEEILATDSVDSITYLHERDSVTLYLVSPPSDQIMLSLKNDGKLLLKDEEISNDT